VQAERARRSLAYFFRKAWHVLEPTTPLQDNWHIDAVCLHLQAAYEGWKRKQRDPDCEQLLQNLVINIPPGTAKSRITCVAFPAWVWLDSPSFRFTFLSSNPRVAMRDSEYTRDLIKSEWYQDLFRPDWEIRDDQDAKTKFGNTAGGFRQAFGFGSRIVGDRSDALVWDDPHDAEEVQSDVQRLAVLDRWDQAIGNRVNDLRSSLRIGIMQRLHEEDLAGHVLNQGGWSHLCLPMEYEEKSPCECPDCLRGETPIGWKDWRKTEGELLFEARFPRPVLEAEKRRLGGSGYAGQMQQRPAPAGGTMFPIGKIRIVDALPAGIQLLRYWDKAGTEGGGAYTAGAKGGIHEGAVYIADMVRGQWASEERNQIMRTTAALDGKATEIWVEREPGSGGKESAEISVKQLMGYDVHIDLVTGDKVTRAKPLAAQCQAGNLCLLRGEWNKAFIDEAELFPNGKYKDQIDAASGMFNHSALPEVPKEATVNPLAHVRVVTRKR